MLRSILIPLSPFDDFRMFVEKAALFARENVARLVGLTVLDLPEIMRVEPVPPGAGAFIDIDHEKKIRHTKQTLEELATVFRVICEDRGVPCSVLPGEGSPDQVIRRESHRHDLILFARGANFKFASQEYPCNTERHVMNHCPRPVIYIPGPGTGDRMIIATDGSSSVSRSVQIFLTLGLLERHRIEVLSIAAEGDHADANCNEMTAFLGQHDINATANPVVSSEKPFHHLLERIMEEPTAAVVMGAFGVSGFKEFFFGSATDTLLKESTVPLYIYH